MESVGSDQEGDGIIRVNTAAAIMPETSPTEMFDIVQSARHSVQRSSKQSILKKV